MPAPKKNRPPFVNLAEDDRVLLEAALADQLAEMEKAHGTRVHRTRLAVLALGVAHLVAAFSAGDPYFALKALLSFLLVSGTAFWYLRFLRSSIDERREEFQELLEGSRKAGTSHPAI